MSPSIIRARKHGDRANRLFPLTRIEDSSGNFALMLRLRMLRNVWAPCRNMFNALVQVVLNKSKFWWFGPPITSHISGVKTKGTRSRLTPSCEKNSMVNKGWSVRILVLKFIQIYIYLQKAKEAYIDSQEVKNTHLISWKPLFSFVIAPFSLHSPRCVRNQCAINVQTASS